MFLFLNYNVRAEKDTSKQSMHEFHIFPVPIKVFLHVNIYSHFCLYFVSPVSHSLKDQTFSLMMLLQDESADHSAQISIWHLITLFPPVP